MLSGAKFRQGAILPGRATWTQAVATAVRAFKDSELGVHAALGRTRVPRRFSLFTGANLTGRRDLSGAGLVNSARLPGGPF